MPKTTRRDFLKNSALAGAAISAPMIWTRSSVRGDDTNSKKTVASIGVGGSRGRNSQGGYIAGEAAKLGQMIAVCDVDQHHNEEFNMKQGGQLNMYTDYRELLDTEKPDIVTIGTPDHWHAPIAIRALRTGCDVYCEKPLTLTIQEGIEIRQVVEETGQIFQVGTQQRSENDLRFLKAVAIVQSGRLGTNVNAYVAVGGGPPDGPFSSAEVPDGLDWDMWVGPAPQAEYSEQRRRMFRWWHEYSGGKMTDWGAHHVDIAQWALGFGESGPVKVNGTGKFPPHIPDNFNWNAFFDGEATLPSGYNTPTEFVINLEFDNGSVLSVHNHYRRDDGTEFENGILFEGENGRIFVNRGKFTGKPLEDLTEADNMDIEERMVELYKGKQPGDHMRNFFECVEERVQPVSDVATHHRTMTSCHLCNIALWLGRDLHWDPEAEHFISDDQANALMTRKSRDGFV